ncbi:MAG: CHAT domain-containing protein [Bacteroidetes bacterium]|nr:CHAT domain-containing protein [Bacteroidota bacterium]MBS1541092.1 CHAT domain-containing protein [Bacteroidota bacterium]
MKKFRHFLFFGLVLGTIGTWAQAKYDKMVKSAETAYEVGDYKKAISNIEKLKSKAFKKLGQQNQYTPIYYLYLAKYQLASGRLKDFETNIDLAISSSVVNYKENSEKHGQLLMNIAELHILNGSYSRALDFLGIAQKVLNAGAWMSDANKARISLLQAEAETGQGYYNESLETLKEAEKYFSGRAVKQESYVDEKGNLKSRRVPDDELKVRYQEYARWMTDQANVYRKQGSYDTADASFSKTSDWIRKNLGRDNLAFAYNQFLYTNWSIENGLQLDRDFLKGTGYDEALNNLKSSHKPSHYLAVSIYEEYLKRLLLQGSTARYQNVKLEFEKMINKSYKGSIYSVRLKAVEFEAKADKNKIKNLEFDANKLLVDNKELPHNNLVTVRVLEFLYELAVYKKDYAGAEKYMTDMVAIKADLYGDDAPETHLQRVKLANFYLDYTNKIAEAGKIYTESFIKKVQPQINIRHKDMLDILNHLANYYELTDNYDAAMAAVSKAKYAAQKKFDNKDPLYAVELTQNAKLQLKIGKYEEAEENLNASLKILEDYRKDEDKKGFLVDAIQTQAALYGIKGLFDEAEDNLDRAAKIISRANRIDVVDESITARELASLFIQLGRYEDTKKLLTDLISQSEKIYGRDASRLIDPLVNMGRLSLAKGDYTETGKLIARASQIARTVYGDKSTKTAQVQLLAGDLDLIIGDYDKAEDNFTKAMQSQEKQFGHNHIEVAKSLARLALTKFYKGDPTDGVEKMMVDAQKILGERLGKDNPQYAEILKKIAIVNIAQKDYSVAFSSLTQAENIWRTKTGSKNNINAASIYTLTGDVYYQMKNYPKAEEFYNSAKKIYESYFSRQHPEYVKILSKMAKVYYMEKDYKRSKRNIEEALNDYDQFIKQYFPALSEREKAKYWNTIKTDFEFYNTLAFGQIEDFRDLSGKVYNYQLLTKALLLSSSIKMRERIQNSNDEKLKATYNDWLQKKELLTNALSMSTQQLLQNNIDPLLLSADVEKLEKELSEKSELFGQSFDNKKITYENVQKSIGKNDVAVEIVRYRYFDHDFTDSIIYVAVYVKNDNARPKVIQLGNGRNMEGRYFHYFRNCIINHVADQYSYKIFWEPIQKEIGQYATIFLSPDGVYNLINLESVPTPDGKYVIDNSNIVIVSNTKDLYLRRIKSRAQASNTATMFGNPKFYMEASANRTIADLPGTEKEVNELKELLKQRGWKTNEYTEVAASEEQVKELESPKIFHIATHGFASSIATEDDARQMTQSEAQLTENPLLKTGLLLKGAGDLLNETRYNFNMTNGILTAYEAMSLNLDKTDLVVLSACETGLGEVSSGEGVYGLQRAFLVAGAKVLIMSMFKVDDEATQKLMLNFYKKWLVSGNLRQSFIDAKKELRTEYPSPIFWGAFMMIGLE